MSLPQKVIDSLQKKIWFFNHQFDHYQKMLLLDAPGKILVIMERTRRRGLRRAVSSIFSVQQDKGLSPLNKLCVGWVA